MSVAEDVGELKGTVDAMKEQLTEVRADVKTLLASENRRKGANAVWALVAGFVGGLIHKLISP